MTIYHLRASSNCTFRLTLNFSALAAAGYDLTRPIKMQMKRSPHDSTPIYTWETGAGSGGLVTMDATTALGIFSAPQADMAGFSGSYTYDALSEQPGGIIPVFEGKLHFRVGVTLPDADASANGASGIGDTVTIDGVSPGMVTVVPVSLTAILAACQASDASVLASAQAAEASAISITATHISSVVIPVNSFRTVGYSTAGDGGDAIYIKGSPSGPMAVQDASGQWWVLAQTGEWSAKSWSAKGDGSTNDTAALNSWLAGCVAYGQSGYAAAGVYRHGGLVLDTSVGSGYAIALRGAHPSQTVFRTLSGTTNAALSIVTGGGGYGGQPQPLLTNFTLDCNNFNSGHGIDLCW